MMILLLPIPVQNGFPVLIGNQSNNVIMINFTDPETFRAALIEWLPEAQNSSWHIAMISVINFWLDTWTFLSTPPRECPYFGRVKREWPISRIRSKCSKITVFHKIKWSSPSQMLKKLKKVPFFQKSSFFLIKTPTKVHVLFVKPKIYFLKKVIPT